MNTVQERPLSLQKIVPKKKAPSKTQKRKESKSESPSFEVNISDSTRKFLKKERQNLKNKKSQLNLPPNRMSKVENFNPLIDRPGIFFVSGLELKSLSSDDGGVEAMAKNLPDAQHFSWNDENKILKEIKRRPIDQPIILVGHSLGGDAVVSVANQLNRMKYGFRNVDLLVTLDSVGFDNDMIPSNVKQNLNFIGDEDIFFNDGPNIARNRERTLVINEIRSEQHTGIDNSKDVHKKIFSKIGHVLRQSKTFNELIKSFAKV
jgi:hypothetical protein